MKICAVALLNLLSSKVQMPLHGAIQRRRRRVYVLFVLDDDMHVEDVTVGVMDSHEPISEDQVNEISSDAREEETCCICLDSNARVFECGHAMHAECAATWFQRSNTCPVCRVEFSPSAQG